MSRHRKELIGMAFNKLDRNNTGGGHMGGYDRCVLCHQTPQVYQWGVDRGGRLQRLAQLLQRTGQLLWRGRPTVQAVTRG